jgi:SPP1 family predicted phage head-tail adaptor
MPQDLVSRIPVASLRYRCKLYKQEQSRTPSGGMQENYVFVADDVWAEIIPLRGASVYYAQSFAPNANMQIKIRYRDDIGPNWVLQQVDTGEAYRVIIQPIDINYRGTILLIYAQWDKSLGAFMDECQ